MKVLLIAAMTADGYIAKDKDHLATDWTNPEDKYLFTHFVKDLGGNMVMGLNTFVTIAKKFPTVFNKAIPGRRLLVYTYNPEDVVPYPNVEAVTEPPEKLVRRLAKEGLKNLTVCGGAQIYTMFMQAGVVDELYIDMQATVFGGGVTIFNGPIDATISLQEIKRLGDNNVLLQYKVEK
nr:RibD C-terminal domain protein [uncultured bacterium]